MRVKRIALTGFRNYEWETIDFSSETNVISGKNAQGKTNLLESIYLLAYGRSFRTRFDKELVNFDYSSSEIIADVVSHDREQTIKIQINPGTSKKITVNGIKKTASGLSDTVNVVLFSPDDLNLIRDGAAVRRKLLDNAICQIRPKYSELLSEYNRLYEHKSRILKDWNEKPTLMDTLDEFSDGLCRCSAKLIRYRASYTIKLNDFASAIHSDFSGSGEILDITYKTVSTVTNPLASEKEIYYEICDHQEKHRRAEIESGQCLTGAHKDDLIIKINNKDAKNYASQGQTRTAALSLKLAEREILLKETGEYPILLLDDVLSELDSGRQEFVLNRLHGGQTLITCCEDGNISERTGGKVIHIDKGRART